MSAEKSKKKWPLKPSPFLGACVAAAVLALLLVVYSLTRPVPMAGSKTITIDVIYEDGQKDTYHVTTEEQYLKGAADQIPELTLDGTTTEEFGLMITQVNGIRADYQLDGAYWALLLNGEPTNYGISMQPIKDGEQYAIVYTPAS